ncbi:helix-turn-helix domain-containing protein [Rhizobium leguminosarum]|uniref:Transcriptional regulator with XRE-family HTH domain n=1 Tax=Rhizobium leguminosarum TaxID=384 RepID=A0A7X0DVX9_RHILE|nr:helix-turn-helix transcriptional regulator [Rhizobium leguminosarum]MBB6224234.1 transcriptional regulator with XRE-family HTH domain [Rhizobium leguminosarum]
MIDNEDVGLKAALRSFGDIVRHKRQACRWVFRELAEKTGIDITSLSDVEAGVDVLTATERETLCEFLGIDIDTFPKILRNERSKAVSTQADTPPEQLRSASIVDLTRYRATWQTTTSHPED